MCGIVAILNKDRARPVDAGVLSAITDLLAHRGPDDRGVLVDGEVGLGHRRLSVIDLAAGHQPMRGPSGRTWIAYNGEVFNYRELRERMLQAGFAFRTSSDTEVLLALYEHEGPSFVRHLNGMFAFALWDERDRSLVLARDPLGIKPLVVWDGPDCMVVASEPKAILGYPGAPRRVRADALAEFVVFRHLAGHRTLFESIESMEPGTVRVYRDGKVLRFDYMENDTAAQPGALSTKQAGTQLRDLLEDAVRMSMVADVPLGAFNSGGLDSSLVSTFASRFKTEPIHTFSVGFAESAYDERPFARQVAGQLGAVHREIVVDAVSFADELPGAIWHHDEPLNHANSVLLKKLSEFARPHVTVVLTGEGSDELFLGYPRYRLVRALEVLRATGRWPERLLALLVRGSGRKARLISSSLGKPDAYQVAANARYVLDEDVAGLFEADAVAGRYAAVSPAEGLTASTQRYDQANYLHNVLQRMDRMTMSVGLEARVPFLDPRIISFARSLRPSTTMPYLRTKAVVKEAARGVLPRSIVHRPKSGFGVPLAEWMRDHRALGRYLEMLREPRSLERGFWSRPRALEIVSEHERGVDHSEVLWSMLNCELWARELLDPARPPARVDAVPEATPR